MSTIGYPVHSSHRTVKMDQYDEETAFGAKDTASPSYTDASTIRQFTNTFNNVTEFYRRFGGRKIYKSKLLRRELTWTGQFAPVDTAMIRYATEPGNSTGTLAGSIDKSLTFLRTWMQNSAGSLVEHFQFKEGTKIDQLTLTSALGILECNFQAISRNIAKPVTTANGGLTTPTYATPTTAVPWCHNTGGGAGQPLVIDGVNYPAISISVTVNNTLDGVDIDGSQYIEALEPTVKNVTFACEIIAGKDLNLDDDIETLVADAASFQLNATGPKTASLTNLVLTNKTADWSSGDTTVDTLVFAGTAEEVTVTA